MSSNQLLSDGAVKIFLNTKGEKDNEVPPRLIKLLRYIESCTDECVEELENEEIAHLHDTIRRIKTGEEMGVEYMNSWEPRESYPQ